MLKDGNPELYIKVTNLEEGLVGGIALHNKKEGHVGLPGDFIVVLHLSL
ncbi:MAG: hypothetical protein ACP5NS_04950 [Candidatus Pacearchaeota archaeon]